MAKIFTIAPSNKLVAVAQALGVSVENMQGTTRKIYDTVTIGAPGSTVGQILTFFNGRRNIATGSNLPEGKFEAVESLAIEQVQVIFNITDTTAQPYSDTYGNDFAPGNAGATNGLCFFSLFIGNQQVINNEPMDADVTGTGHNGQKFGMRLEEALVIPPQVEIRAEVRSNIAGARRVSVSLYGLGALINLKTNL
jgi:hypothetical protein